MNFFVFVPLFTPLPRIFFPTLNVSVETCQAVFYVIFESFCNKMGADLAAFYYRGLSGAYTRDFTVYPVVNHEVMVTLRQQSYLVICCPHVAHYDASW